MQRSPTITFDLWDTLVIDDSDEVERARRGLPTKPEARLQLVTDAFLAGHPSLDSGAVAAAWDHATATFRVAWRQRHRTPPVRQRLVWTAEALGVGLPQAADHAIVAIERMEADIPPVAAPGAAQAVRALAARYRLGIISDAIVTPGRELRRVLDGMGILDCFSSIVFSDEAGAAKPDPSVFERAAAELGGQPSDIIHIGDREANDVMGVQGVGGRAVLYVGAVDRRSGPTAADAVCAHHDELPRIIDSLAQGGRP